MAGLWIKVEGKTTNSIKQGKYGFLLPVAKTNLTTYSSQFYKIFKGVVK